MIFHPPPPQKKNNNNNNNDNNNKFKAKQYLWRMCSFSWNDLL